MSLEITGFRPGALGRIIELHGRYYAEAWDFDARFEAEVAREMGEFLARFDPARDGIWLAVEGADIVGSIVIDGAAAEQQGARIRWFIIDPACHGRGVGRRLLDEAMAFCRKQPWHRVYLDTFAGLDAARRLYEDQGFQLIDERFDRDWNVAGVTHQTFECFI